MDADGNGRGSWTGKHTFGTIAITVLIVIVSILYINWESLLKFLSFQKDVLPLPQGTALLMWGFNMVALAVLALIIGQGITGRWSGVLIDNRNRMTLSRFQILVWTVVIVSGWGAAALWNIANRDALK